MFRQEKFDESRNRFGGILILVSAFFLLNRLK